MDTGAILLRQLRAARAFTVTPADREQVEWWRAQIGRLHAQQPRAEAAAEAAEAGTVEHLAPTGTEGGQ